MKFFGLGVFVGIIFLFLSITSFKLNLITNNEPDKTIKIGLLIQDNKSLEAKYGAEMAIRKINAKGGLNGRPLKLVIRSMEGPWGTGSKQAVDLIFTENVWALLGSHDGRNAHLVEQVATKSRVVFISALASDPSLSKAFVPWFFNCVPNDIQQAGALIDEIYNKRKLTKIALVADDGYDSKLAQETFISNAKKAGKPEPLKFLYNNTTTDFTSLLNLIDKSKVSAIVLLGQPQASKKIIQQIRQRKAKYTLFGSLSLLCENNDNNGNLNGYENLVVISTASNSSAARTDFQKEYFKENGKLPGINAEFAFDGINVLAKAIKNCGFDIAKLQNSIAKIQYDGVTGLIQFDAKGNRIGVPGLFEIKNGKFVELTN